MSLKKFSAAVAALMLTASPVLAQANPAPQPRSEEVSATSSLAGTANYLGAVVGVAIIGLILYILVQDDDDEATSP